MLVQIRDRGALSNLSIVSLRTYLNMHGWHDLGSWGERPASIYAKEQLGQTWEILVPTRNTIADYVESMSDAVAVLAAAEERSQLDVFYDLSAVGADVIHVRSITGPDNESLSLRQSASLLNDSYNMLASAARAAEKPRAAYRGKISSDIAEYLDNVQALPGYTRGYSITLHSPVPAGFGTQEDFGDDFRAPFPRLATLKLAEALKYSSTAISEVVTKDSLEPFRQMVSHGVSANLCDSVAELAKKARGIEIDLAWADVRPSNTTESRFSFSVDYAEILVEAAKSFRRDEPSFDEQLEAQVVLLEKDDPNDFDGIADIVSNRDGRLVRIRVEFSESDYDIVIQAFRDHRYISLDGDIHPVGNRFQLRNPRNVSLV